MMKANTFREQTNEEILGNVEQMGRELLDLRMKNKMGDSSVQSLKIRELRRDIARAKTVLSEKKKA